MGRPAPSVIRNAVNAVEICSWTAEPRQARALMNSFMDGLNQGEISQPILEDLASTYAKYGPASRARRCYSLLVLLADKNMLPDVSKQFWKDQLRKLGPSEYAEEMKLFEQSSARGEWSVAFSYIVKANTVRTEDPALAKLFPWSEIQSGIDKLEPNIPLESQHYFLAKALEMAQHEKKSTALNSWIDGKRRNALITIRQIVDAIDQAISQGQYVKALHETQSAVCVATIDSSISKHSDWKGLIERVEIIQSKIETPYRLQCQALIEEIKTAAR